MESNHRPLRCQRSALATELTAHIRTLQLSTAQAACIVRQPRRAHRLYAYCKKRRRPESNRGIVVLQTTALPLGYASVAPFRSKICRTDEQLLPSGNRIIPWCGSPVNIRAGRYEWFFDTARPAQNSKRRVRLEFPHNTCKRS